VLTLRAVAYRVRDIQELTASGWWHGLLLRDAGYDAK
jgi:hypothetical protein